MQILLILRIAIVLIPAFTAITTIDHGFEVFMNKDTTVGYIVAFAVIAACVPTIIVSIVVVSLTILVLSLVVSLIRGNLY